MRLLAYDDGQSKVEGAFYSKMYTFWVLASIRLSDFGYDKKSIVSWIERMGLFKSDDRFMAKNLILNPFLIWCFFLYLVVL